jgi:integrase
MPRLSNSLPKYRKHRASGQAVVMLNGRDFYLGPHNTKASKVEYDRRIGEWLANNRSSPTGEAADITVAELLLRYWKFAKGYYRKDGKPTGEVDNLKSALRPVRELYGSTPASEFGPLALEAVRKKLVDQQRTRKGVNQAIGRVKRVFRWGVSKELIPASVAQALSCLDGLKKGRTTAPESPPVAPVASATLEATVAHLPSVVTDMALLQRLTGMRPGEVCIMRPCDIDRSGDVWLYQPESHKTEHHGRDRVVPIGPKGQEILLRYLARDASMYCFRPCDSEEKRRAAARANRKTPLSCGNRPGSNLKRKPNRSAGECYTVNSYRRAIKRGCDKAFPHPSLGYKLRAKFADSEKKELRKWQSEHQWNPNQLRHSAGTEVRREFGLEAAQTVLGHANADTTQIYAERDVAKAIEVARQIG